MPERKAGLVNDAFVDSRVAQRSVWRMAALLLVFDLVWFQIIRPLQSEWSYNQRIRGRPESKIGPRRRREIGAQILELLICGCESDAEATAALPQQLGQIVARA